MKKLTSLLAASVGLMALTACGAHEPPAIDVPSRQATAFTNVSLVPMTEETVVSNQTVLVVGGKIAEIGPSHEIEIPPGVAVIDGTGAYLMPGLADMHMHTRQEWLSDDWPASPLRLYLANGVTTVRDFGPHGTPPSYVLRWRDDIDDGRLIGPTIYAAGPILWGPVDDARKRVEEIRAQGFDFLKLYSFLSKDEFREAMTAAERIGMYTAGHIPFAVGLDGVLSEGMDEIAHVEELSTEFLDLDRTKQLRPRDWFPYLIGLATQQTEGVKIEDVKREKGDILSHVIARLKAEDVPVCTTLVVDSVIVQKLHQPGTFRRRPESRYLPRRYWNAFARGQEKHQVQFKGAEDFADFKYALDRLLLAELKQAGVRLILGSDAGTGAMGLAPGFSVHDELQLLTENGFTPYEAIAAGTSVASRIVSAMTGKDDFGAIAVGRRADLLLVASNPLEDVTNIKRLRGVMAAGRWFPKETLDRMLAIGNEPLALRAPGRHRHAATTAPPAISFSISASP